MSEAAIVLIGPMGAGKTSVGKRVAKALGVPFYDSDAAVVRGHGPIADIFAMHGETRFRELERDAVATGLAQGGVVALGGGAVLDPQTQEALRAHRVVLLTVDPAIIAGRIRGGARPLLGSAGDGGDDAVARWNAVYETRRDLYARLADVTFDTSSGPLQGVVDAVVAWASPHPSTTGEHA
ncbi:shikimate kinase [Microbacterium telephonicum]|uniref:Shikimate kinase n=1 Tax=Microbacterium telephonicum TaxID=1714841 RepID=A0A498BZM3_9MICO|nr:shikimate kinase [Microbacterium telephonicum]RLK49184.1 shikimate kinase [Microbacterium telephonicum]